MLPVDISIVVYNGPEAQNFYLRQEDGTGGFVRLDDPAIENKGGDLIPVYHRPEALAHDLRIATNLATAIEILVNYLAHLANRVGDRVRPLPGMSYSDFEWNSEQRLFLPNQTWLADYLRNPAYYWERWKNPSRPDVPYVLFDAYAVELSSPLEIKIVVKKVRTSFVLGILAALFSSAPMTTTIGNQPTTVATRPPTTATREPISKQSVDILSKQRLLQYGRADTEAEKKAIQTDLKILGHYIGDIDGGVGPQSKQAFMTYGLKHGIINAPWGYEIVLTYLADDIAVLQAQANRGG